MRTKLIAIGMIASVWAGSAQADPIVARVVGGVLASVVASAIVAQHQPKLARCTLYDREGNPVTVSCPADVAAATAHASISPAPPPAPVQSAPLPPPPRYAEAPPPPPAYAAPAHPRPYAQAAPAYAEPPCGCPAVDSMPRAVASYLESESRRGEVTYSHPRVVERYDVYEDSQARYADYRESRYGAGLSGGVGDNYYVGGGVYPYGGVGYEAGGYAQSAYSYHARTAGRDPAGFLTWPGKR